MSQLILPPIAGRHSSFFYTLSSVCFHWNVCTSFQPYLPVKGYKTDEKLINIPLLLDDFVSEVEDELSAICRLPLRDPILTKCGHRFCRLP